MAKKKKKKKSLPGERRSIKVKSATRNTQVTRKTELGDLFFGFNSIAHHSTKPGGVKNTFFYLFSLKNLIMRMNLDCVL